MTYKEHNTKIILIAGKARSGKSTLSEYLKKEYEKENKKVIISPYTKYLKKYIEEITEEKIDENNKPRELLQKLSSDLIKPLLGTDFFIKRQLEDIKIYAYFKDVIIIPDVRFPKEIEDLKKEYNNIVTIGIKRKEENDLTEEQKKDITETSLDNYNNYDYLIENNNIDLKKEAQRIIKKIEERSDSMIIAIDGPAGSGKGTLAKALAEELNLINIDTGATYRCVALKALRNNLSIDNEKEIINISKNIKIELKPDGKVLMDGEDVTKKIREKEVTEIVSQISSIVEVRENLVEVQRKIAEGKNVVMEGRDITTVVFPNAKYKIYLDASLDCRVERRYKEYKEKGIEMTYEEIKENIIKRDENDKHKKVGSLKRTKDQTYIDTTDMTIEEEVEMIKKIVKGDKDENND